MRPPPNSARHAPALVHVFRADARFLCTAGVAAPPVSAVVHDFRADARVTCTAGGGFAGVSSGTRIPRPGASLVYRCGQDGGRTARGAGPSGPAPALSPSLRRRRQQVPHRPPQDRGALGRGGELLDAEAEEHGVVRGDRAEEQALRAAEVPPPAGFPAGDRASPTGPGRSRSPRSPGRCRRRPPWCRPRRPRPHRSRGRSRS